MYVCVKTDEPQIKMSAERDEFTSRCANERTERAVSGRAAGHRRHWLWLSSLDTRRPITHRFPSERSPV